MVAAIPLIVVFGVAFGLLGSYFISHTVYRAMTRSGSKLGMTIGFFTFLTCAFVLGILLSLAISSILGAELARLLGGILGA